MDINYVVKGEDDELEKYKVSQILKNKEVFSQALNQMTNAQPIQETPK